MLARGALDTDFGWDFAALRANGWGRREMMASSSFTAAGFCWRRWYSEKLRKYENVGFVEGARITGFIANENRSRVLGVKTISE